MSSKTPKFNPEQINFGSPPKKYNDDTKSKSHDFMQSKYASEGQKHEQVEELKEDDINAVENEKDKPESLLLQSIQEVEKLQETNY